MEDQLTSLERSSSFRLLIRSQNNTIEDATRTLFETEEVGILCLCLSMSRSGNHERAAETERCVDECFRQGEGYHFPLHAGERRVERRVSWRQSFLENEQEVLAEKVVLFVARNTSVQ